MKLHFKLTPIHIAVIALFAIVAVILMPRPTFAEAGNGGGNSGGCGSGNFCTSYGAVWRYQFTNSNSVNIKGLYGTSVNVTGCGVYGGFFMYVLLGKNGNNDYRSWAIGRPEANSNSNTYRSVYFPGGQTKYLPSINNGPNLPATLVHNGDYNWTSVQNAFNGMPVAQRNGYAWNSTSRLGWFCYSSRNYSLAPSISTSATAVTAGSTVNAIGAMANAGPTSSGPVDWQISRFTLAPGAAIPVPNGGVSAAGPSAFIGNGATAVDSGNTSFPINTYTFNPRTVTVPDVPVGSKLCFVLSVQPYTQTSSNWRHSPVRCVVVSKKPNVQVLGGDLRVGSAFVGSTAPALANILTSITVKSGKTYGSWGEYGVMASGNISGIGSGSAYSDGCAAGCVTNPMTFANAATPNGRYVSTTSIPSVASSFPISSSTPVFNSLADASLKRVETASGPVTIAGGTIQRGNWLVLNAPSSTVTITGDITYENGPFASLSDIPQLVIIADQINIEGNVRRVDAWLIASGAAGVINTCSAWNGAALAVTAPLTKDICSNDLIVNGPVSAKKLHLRRTAGAGTAAASDASAEVFNLRSDAYLWGVNRASGSARVETTYTKELPPRF